MSKTGPRKTKEDIDYKVYHTRGRKDLIERQSAVMNTALERLVIREKSCVEDISEFFETNEFEEVEAVEDLTEYLSTLAELSKEFRHDHAELKLTCKDYEKDFAQSHQHLENMRKFIKQGKSKLKTLRKNEADLVESNKLGLEKKKLLSEEEYILDRLNRNLKSIDLASILLVSDVDQAIFKIETLFEDYLKLHCNLKVVCGEGYKNEFTEKVEINTDLVNQKFSECNLRMNEILDDQRKVEEQTEADEAERMRIQKEDRDKQVLEEQREELFLAKQTSKEIELRCAQ